MQTQDTSTEFLYMKLWPWLEANWRKLVGLLVVVIVAMGVFYLISERNAQREIEAGEALSMQLVNPSANSAASADAFNQIAAKYSGTLAAKRAELDAAASLFDAGKYPEAQAQFQKFVDANPSGALAATAQLGVASSLEAQNKSDLAVAAYQRVVSLFAGSTSVPEAEFALGRIAEQHNKLSEAQTHYESAARAAMGGSLAQEAAMRAAEIKTKLAAAAPKPATAPKPAATTAAPATPAK